MLRRVVLIAALALLVMPTVALADGIDFSFYGGTLGFAGNGGLTNGPAGSVLGSVSYIPLGGGPSVGCGNPTNCGTVVFTTGAFNGNTGNFDAGGSIVITSNATFGTNTGIAPTTLFSGTFSGPTLWTWLSGSSFSLSGAVSGNVDPALYAFLGLPNANPATGFIVTLIIGQDQAGNWVIFSGDIGVVSPVPEPGTLALFGTGLIGMAGIIRRRLKA